MKVMITTSSVGGDTKKRNVLELSEKEIKEAMTEKGQIELAKHLVKTGYLKLQVNILE